MQERLTHISEAEFLAVVAAENCRSIIDERYQAASPEYLSYTSSAQKFLLARVFPPWRTTHDGTTCIGDYRVSKAEASVVSFLDLSTKTHLFASICFDSGRDYLCTNRVITFHCQTCGVRVVKDGNHRLLQCALKRSDPELRVFEVRSKIWAASTVDMKNFCECISNNSLEGDACKATRASG